MAYSTLLYKEYKTNQSQVPPGSFKVGMDEDGTQIYLGRVDYAGDVLPAKVIPEKNAIYTSYDGLEIFMKKVDVVMKEVNVPRGLADCDVPIPEKYVWIQSFNGAVPETAVRFGRTGYGEVLYVGRAYFSESLTPGKIHPSHGCLYIPWDGSEIPLKTYEVLCLQYKKAQSSEDEEKPMAKAKAKVKAKVKESESEEEDEPVAKAKSSKVVAKATSSKGGVKSSKARASKDSDDEDSD